MLSSRVASSLLYTVIWFAASFCSPGRVDAVKIRHRAERGDSPAPREASKINRNLLARAEVEAAVPDQVKERGLVLERIAGFLPRQSNAGFHPGKNIRAASTNERDHYDRQTESSVERDARHNVRAAAVDAYRFGGRDERLPGTWEQFAALPQYMREDLQVVRYAIRSGIINTFEQFRALPEPLRKDMFVIEDALRHRVIRSWDDWDALPLGRGLIREMVEDHVGPLLEESLGAAPGLQPPTAL